VAIKDYLLYTDSNKVRFLYGRKNSGWRLLDFFFLALVRFFSLFYPLKPIFRWADFYFFSEKNKNIKNYFDEFHPDLIFSTSIISSLDIAFMKEAKRRGIKTVSMQKSWDNATRDYYRFIPDYFLVQNELLIDISSRLQRIPKNSIYTVGLPQFDWYKRDEVLRSREEHFARMGFDQERSLLFFGSEGMWAPEEAGIAKKIYEWILNDELARPCQLLVRPHYSNVKSDIFREFRGKKDVVVDNYRIVDFLNDRWDPSTEETIDLTNSVLHSDIMINAASTLSLDAACVDVPVIHIGFGCNYKNGEDITDYYMYRTDHDKWVLSTGGTEKVDSFEELRNQINRYLVDPSLRSEGRKKLREKLCYKVDGKSSERMADAINDILRK